MELFLFPKLILPLFYKLEDLPDGELKQQLSKFMNTCDFEASKCKSWMEVLEVVIRMLFSQVW